MSFSLSFVSSENIIFTFSEISETKFVILLLITTIIM